MKPVVHALLAFVVSWLRSRLSLQLETVALRHQLAGISELDPTAAHSSNRPYPVVLAGAGLVCLVGGADLRAAHHRNRLAA